MGKYTKTCFGLAGSAALLLTSMSVHATGIVRLPDAGSFTPEAGLITFSEFGLGTTNPTYTPADYGGGAGAPTVTFDGFFSGQGLSATPGVDCPGGAASGCVVGSPTGPLTLDALAPDTFITSDGANPTSPVLSGTPQFSGPIAVHFDLDQAGVALDAGFFDAAGGTAITAFDRTGAVLGSVVNIGTGIEFLGLITDDGSESIAGLLFSLVGSEPAGFAIDNVRFGASDQVIDPRPVPVPSALALLALGLAGFGVRRIRG
jgi:hypothetical protein